MRQLLLFLAFYAAAFADNTPPNVILILADDMCPGDLSSLNGGISKTPNLDRLKEESLWFSKAYSASPVCAPARAALLTGRYPHRTGVVTLNMEKYPELTSLRLDEVTMAERFRASGYATGLIGKWHLGDREEYHPLERGFDEFEGFIGHLYVPKYSNFKLDIQRETQKFPGRYLTTDLSERAVKFVRRHQEKPFFLHLAHYAPHRPLDAPEERIQPYLDAGLDQDTATVYAMIEIMDEGIGQLLAELNTLGIQEKTLVIFASDNGADSLVTQRENLDLRGSKYEVHEGGIRVPFMMHWPGRVTPGESETLIHFTDVLPTLMELCELKPVESPTIDGRSFAALLTGNAAELPARRFWQWNRWEPLYSHNAAMREDRWKLVRPFVTKNMPEGESDQAPVLFDLETDPAETKDLSKTYPERYDEMRKALEAWCQEVEKDRVRP